MNLKMVDGELKINIGERLGDILFRTELVGVRAALACAEIIWAISLLWPGATFDREPYRLMASIMGETLWGLAFALTAWAQWSLVIIGDFKCAFARWFSFWNCLLWITVTGTMYLSVYPPPAAISGETTLALAAFWIFVRPFIYKGGGQ